MSLVARLSSGQPGERSALVRRWTTWLPTALVALPIVVAAVRAAAGDWVPTGDDAYFTVRGGDVLTDHHPLLGAWSSGSASLDASINNPGPMQADLLAVFVRWTPMGGTAIGVAASNLAAIVAIAWLIRRLMGAGAAAVAMVLVGAMTWTMGSEMLITPRQHQYLLLPYLCVLVATWATACGDRVAPTVFVVAASLVVQTHLSYPVLVIVLGIVAFVGASLAWRLPAGNGLTMPQERYDERARPLAVAAGVAIVLWAQPLYEQVAGEGNLSNLMSGSGEAERVGLSDGIRLVAGVVVSPFTLSRPGFRHYDAAMVFAGWWRVVVLVAMIGGLIAAATRLLRPNPVVGWACVTAAAALAGGVLSAAVLPPTDYGIVVMNYRWLWPTACGVVGAAVAAVLAFAQNASPPRHSAERVTSPDADAPGSARTGAATAGASAVVVVASVMCAVLAVANLPRSVQSVHAERYLDEQASVVRVLADVDRAAGAGEIPSPVLIDDTGMYFGAPFTYPLLIVLQQHGIEFRFEAPRQHRRFGSGRAADGSEVAVLSLVSGAAAVSLQEAPGLVSFDAAGEVVAITLEPLRS